MNLAVELNNLKIEGWLVRLYNDDRYGWCCTLQPNHLDFSRGPFGAGDTPEQSVKMAKLDAQQRKIYNRHSK